MSDRHSENSQGDFYVESGVCTTCGAPQAEAPDLIDHSELDYGHCYFKKQPKTDDEIERAISAIAVSCISGLRYGGTNEKILKRLYEIGEGEQCDHKPLGNYKTLIWNKVTFKYKGSIKELSELMTTQIILGHPHLKKEIINFKLLNDNYFEFIYRWSTGPGNIFKCYSIADKSFCVEIEIEEKGNEISIRGRSMVLNSILSSDKNVSEICWFDKENIAYSSAELR
ncbi:MAG TPA: ferredoxin [Chryseolinea sp.]